jgi:hypothetical protein
MMCVALGKQRPIITLIWQGWVVVACETGIAFLNSILLELFCYMQCGSAVHRINFVMRASGPWRTSPLPVVVERPCRARVWKGARTSVTCCAVRSACEAVAQAVRA